jgi:hypothetical protein
LTEKGKQFIMMRMTIIIRIIRIINIVNIGMMVGITITDDNNGGDHYDDDKTDKKRQWWCKSSQIMMMMMMGCTFTIGIQWHWINDWQWQNFSFTEDPFCLFYRYVFTAKQVQECMLGKQGKAIMRIMIVMISFTKTTKKTLIDSWSP